MAKWLVNAAGHRKDHISKIGIIPDTFSQERQSGFYFYSFGPKMNISLEKIY